MGDIGRKNALYRPFLPGPFFFLSLLPPFCYNPHVLGPKVDRKIDRQLDRYIQGAPEKWAPPKKIQDPVRSICTYLYSDNLTV